MALAGSARRLTMMIGRSVVGHGHAETKPVAAALPRILLQVLEVGRKP